MFRRFFGRKAPGDDVVNRLEVERPRSQGDDRTWVERLARERLPGQLAEQWLALLRPAVHLTTEISSPVLARLGGRPSLPQDVDWPIWEGHGPLSFVGEVDCAEVAKFPLDVEVPSGGRLLFFFFDGSYDNFQSIVGTWDASSLAGARVLYVPPGIATAARPTPDGVEEFAEKSLGGRSIVTAPGWEHPALREAFLEPGADHRTFMNHPVNDDDFQEALHERLQGPQHQIGGYSEPVQGPIEFEVAHAALNNEVDYRDDRLAAEARRWNLLLQVDSDDDVGMMWGDVGILYWLIRGNAFVPDVTTTSFTWQCA